MTKTEFYKWRKKAGLSQVAAGKVCDKSRRHAQRYDSGEYTPSPAEITALMVLAGYDDKKIKKYLLNAIDNAP